MRIPLHQVDAFARAAFAGNPAAVCPLDSWIYDATMKRIAAENNVSETAFIVPYRNEYEIRWFTPVREVDLCGHATLASGYVVLTHIQPQRQAVRFFTRSAGELSVARDGDRLTMALPRRDPRPMTAPPELVSALGGPPPREVVGFNDYYLCVYDDAATVDDLAPDFTALAKLGDGQRFVCVTGPGTGFDCDFVSRFFAPSAGIDEDPVTGSAHCLLVPYWAARLKRDSLFAKQISNRGGEIWCHLGSDHVALSGYVAPYLVGVIDV